MIPRDTRIVPRAPSVVVDAAIAMIHEASRDIDGVSERLSGKAYLSGMPKNGESVHMTVPIHDGEFRLVLVSTATIPRDGELLTEKDIHTARFWYRDGDDRLHPVESSRLKMYKKQYRQLAAKILNIAIRSQPS